MTQKNVKLTKATGLKIALSVLFLVAILTIGFPQRLAADDYDPPSRVARLNYTRGSVSFQPGGENDWVPATVNRPLTTDDKLWTDQGARAELQLGSATIRLNSETGFSFLNLDDSTVQIQLTEGTLNIRVRRMDRDDFFEIDTPNQAFSILQPGQYRIEARPDGYSTMIDVRSGQGEVTGGGRIYTVNSGLTGEFIGTDNLQANIYRSGGTDEFDSWSQDRDRRYDGSRSARYVSSDLVGYEDLDDNGSWSSDPDYGDVWIPRVNAGWAPYHDGHWAWISPWGWTWVDDAPWGYAPFHYGRWVNARGRWGWVPGPINVRPVYAPALVAFIGGSNFSLSLSFGGGGGGVGWFPLGPREVYVPSYRTSRAYVDRVNVTNTTVNVTTITNVYNIQNSNDNRRQSSIRYANRAVPGGVTAVSRNVFTGAQPVGRAAVSLNQQQISSAPVRQTADVAPTRNSVFGRSVSPGSRVAQPPPAVANRTVVARRPPPPAPVSFERQQQQLSAHPGQPLARTEIDNLRPRNAPADQPRVRQAPPGRPATANSNQPAPNQPANVQPNAPQERPGQGQQGRGFGRPNQQQPAAVQPTPAPPPPATNAPVNNQPTDRPGRQDQQGQQGRGFGGRPNQEQPAVVQPTPAQPPATNAPVNNQPADRPGRQDQQGQQGRGFGGRPNQEQPAVVQPTPAQPPATNAPVNNQPADRPGRQDQQGQQGRGFGGRPNQEQPAVVQPTPAQPPPAANAPVNNQPADRSGRQDRPGQQGRGFGGRPNQEQPAVVQPTPAPPPPAANAPVNNTPPDRPGRNERGDRPNQPPANVQPSAVPPRSIPPPSPAANPPATPPATNTPPERPGRNNRPPDKPTQAPPPTPAPATPPAAPADNAAPSRGGRNNRPPQETPQNGKDKQKDQGDKSK